ncbi:MAG: DEAD/DEAH box helicase, partial [Deltaproteobacteria bacterium]|nr:DEAD/DEAH box helicase [Deltaproteobacteria bacterium]
MNLSNGGSETKKAEESAQDLAPPEAASGSRAQAQVSQNQEHPQANQNLANQDLASQNLANKDLANQNLAKKDSANPNHLSDGDNDNAESRALRPNFLTATRFSDFDLPQEIMSGIDAAGFDCCTPIQAQVIPVALSGEDVAGQAQTGTGKTTAFLVPVLTRLLRRQPMAPGLPRALVITPTRELAVQIHKDAKLLAGATELTHALVVGGLEYREQAEALEAGADLIICTPGRLIDYLYKRVFVPTAIEVVVVDEADRLLDMGFIKDLKTILSQLPPYNHRQTMLFSATLDDRVLELTYQYMNPPQYITAEPDPTSKIQIDQSLYHISHREKLPLLLGLLSKEEHNRVIIFCNTKSGVEWLTKKLVYNGFQAEGITGDLPQPKRLKLMEAFKEQRLQIMVATDVASRGIHVEDVSHVYNFDLPQDAENYIHRIGRTARAGKSGKAVSFASEEHVFHLEAIENILGEKIPVVWPDDDMFAVDHGQDFKPKERERERKPYVKDRERRIPSTPSSISAPEAPRSSERRDKVRIQRPGGIFGLSPRFPVLDGVSDPRQELTWRPADVKNDPPETVRSVAQNAYDSHAQAIDREASGLTEAWPAAQGGHGSFEERATEPREGRRRKRRRGKGPKDHELPQAGQTAITIGSSDYSQDNLDLRSPEGS